VRIDVLNPSWMILARGSGAIVAPVFLATHGICSRASRCSRCIAAHAAHLDRDQDRGRLARAGALHAEPGGLDGRTFKVLKFRSMRPDAELSGAQWAQRKGSARHARGAIIRQLRVDELPQVINVLRGHMSFVGPRPERPEFVANLAEKIPYYVQRHCVKPGITGWAQLCYPYGSSEQDALEKLQYDLYYIKNNSLLFDLAILVQTAEVVLFGKGAR